MLLSSILGLSAGFGVFWTVKRKELYPGIITISLVIGVLLAILLPKSLQQYGFIVYTGAAGLAVLYAILATQKTIWERILLLLFSGTILCFWIWVMMHWHGNTFLLPIVTLLSGFAALVSKADLKRELGFTVILTADAIAILLERTLY